MKNLLNPLFPRNICVIKQQSADSPAGFHAVFCAVRPRHPPAARYPPAGSGTKKQAPPAYARPAAFAEVPKMPQKTGARIQKRTLCDLIAKRPFKSKLFGFISGYHPRLTSLSAKPSASQETRSYCTWLYMPVYPRCTLGPWRCPYTQRLTP